MPLTKKILVVAICAIVLLILLSVIFGFYFFSQKLSPAADEVIVVENLEQEEVSEPQEVEVTDADREQIMIDLESNLAQEVELEPDDVGIYLEATEDGEQEITDDAEPTDSNDSSATSGQNTQEEESSGEMSREERASILADLDSNQEQEVEPE
jgi:hypothetical protein